MSKITLTPNSLSRDSSYRVTIHQDPFRALFARSLLLLTAYSSLTLAVASTKVISIAVQGAGSGSKQVLSLIRGEEANIVLLPGDSGYDPSTGSPRDNNFTQARAANINSLYPWTKRPV